jgi:hypothetical protein
MAEPEQTKHTVAQVLERTNLKQAAKGTARHLLRHFLSRQLRFFFVHHGERRIKLRGRAQGRAVSNVLKAKRAR